MFLGASQFALLFEEMVTISTVTLSQTTYFSWGASMVASLCTFKDDFVDVLIV